MRVYSTKYFDGEVELYYYGYRYYSPEFGRWINRDPINERGFLVLSKYAHYRKGDLNLYAFIQNNSINRTDLFGLSSVLINVIRKKEYCDCTIGELIVNGQKIGYTLELPWKKNKEKKSRIPSGSYFGVTRTSKQFPYLHIKIKRVLGRKDILIHRGNEPKDTEGCILVGKTKKKNKCWIRSSRKAHNELMEIVKITQTIDKAIGEYTEILISIKDLKK
ncbi:MAG: DUF5675 family protein [Promethearchaeota archaeon]